MKTETTNYIVRLLVKTSEGISRLREEFGPDLVKACNVYMEMRANLPKDQHKFLSLCKIVTTQEHISIE